MKPVPRVARVMTSTSCGLVSNEIDMGDSRGGETIEPNADQVPQCVGR